MATAGEFFFRAPAGVRQFGVRICGEGHAEGVKAALVDPQGKIVEQLDDVAQLRQFEVTRPEGSPGEIFGILGSMGFLEVATNRGSASQLLGAGKGSEVNVIV